MNTRTKKLVDQLTRIGLTKSEANTYLALLEHGSLSAVSMGKYTNSFPNAVYRLMAKLAKRGFVVELGTSPKTFQAVPPFAALEKYQKHQNKKLEEVKQQIIKSATGLQQSKESPTRMEIIASRKDMFKTHVKLMKKVKKDVQIISIGEPVPDEIKLAHIDAISRGVKIKLLVHRHDKKNERLLKSWIAMKTDVKHFQDSGYHMMIYDGKISVIVTNNPKNTAERIGFIAHNSSLAHALQEYFKDRWRQAKIINSS